MPSEDNNVLKKEQYLETESNGSDDLELNNYRQNTKLSNLKQNLSNAEEATHSFQNHNYDNKSNDAFQANKSKKNNDTLYYSCVNISTHDDDKLSGVTKDNYRYYDALDYYRTCLRRGYFVEDDILKIKRETGGSDSVEITIDDFDKIVQWQVAHNLVDKNNHADGKFGEQSIKVYNDGKDPSNMIIIKRQKLNFPDKKDVAKNAKIISYLKSDDLIKYDIHLDNSDSCQFYNDTDEFLTNYSTQQTIPFSFLKKLVEHRNFALITIIISTANYGVTDIPDDLALRELDPVVKGGYYPSEDACVTTLKMPCLATLKMPRLR